MAHELKPTLEAILIAAQEPISSEKLAEFVGVELREVNDELSYLAQLYEDQACGFMLKRTARGWRYMSRPQYDASVRKALSSLHVQPLSQAALETLAIVAYLGKVTREQIKSIRGVNSDSSLQLLLEKGLIRKRGKDSDTGAQQYGPTLAFYEHFGISSTRDLPDLSDLAADDTMRERIKERLAAHD